MFINRPEIGIAGFASEEVTYAEELLAGDTPAIVTISSSVPEVIRTTGLARWTPVIVNYDTGVMSLPDYTADPVVKPNAITTNTIQVNAPAGTNMPVYKAGCFNVNAIRFNDAVTDEADKLNGFDSEVIVVKKRIV